MAIPRFIISNPYRLLGIPANCPERDIVAAASKLRAFARVGKTQTQPLDFDSILGKPLRTVAVIDTCEKIRFTTPSRLSNALVWFSVSAQADAEAVNYLRQGDIRTAYARFALSEGYSSLINRAVLDFINGNLKEAIEKICHLIGSQNLRERFVADVLGENMAVGPEDLMNNFFTLISGSYSFETLSLAVSGSDAPQNALNLHFRRKWRTETENCLNLIKYASVNDPDALSRIIDRIKALLERLEEISPLNDISLNLLADQSANAILNLVIRDYNSDPSSDMARKSISLLKTAIGMARSNQLRQRCKDNYSTLLSNLNTP
ncbi:MAG: hypothetical protein UH625_02415 [Muribaculaceae bacterium]|nr:hypothetical protein [Muribaculaceae bacterium]